MRLTDYFEFYNEEWRHQSLGYETPSVVYQIAMTDSYPDLQYSIAKTFFALSRGNLIG